MTHEYLNPFLNSYYNEINYHGLSSYARTEGLDINYLMCELDKSERVPKRKIELGQLLSEIDDIIPTAWWAATDTLNYIRHRKQGKQGGYKSPLETFREDPLTVFTSPFGCTRAEYTELLCEAVPPYPISTLKELEGILQKSSSAKAVDALGMVQDQMNFVRENVRRYVDNIARTAFWSTLTNSTLPFVATKVEIGIGPVVASSYFAEKCAKSIANAGDTMNNLLRNEHPGAIAVVSALQAIGAPESLITQIYSHREDPNQATLAYFNWSLASVENRSLKTGQAIGGAVASVADSSLNPFLVVALAVPAVQKLIGYLQSRKSSDEDEGFYKNFLGAVDRIRRHAKRAFSGGSKADIDILYMETERLTEYIKVMGNLQEEQAKKRTSTAQRVGALAAGFIGSQVGTIAVLGAVSQAAGDAVVDASETYAKPPFVAKVEKDKEEARAIQQAVNWRNLVISDSYKIGPKIRESMEGDGNIHLDYYRGYDGEPIACDITIKPGTILISGLTGIGKSAFIKYLDALMTEIGIKSAITPNPKFERGSPGTYISNHFAQMSQEEFCNTNFGQKLVSYLISNNILQPDNVQAALACWRDEWSEAEEKIAMSGDFKFSATSSEINMILKEILLQDFGIRDPIKLLLGNSSKTPGSAGERARIQLFAAANSGAQMFVADESLSPIDQDTRVKVMKATYDAIFGKEPNAMIKNRYYIIVSHDPHPLVQGAKLAQETGTGYVTHIRFAYNQKPKSSCHKATDSSQLLEDLAKIEINPGANYIASAYQILQEMDSYIVEGVNEDSLLEALQQRIRALTSRYLIQTPERIINGSGILQIGRDISEETLAEFFLSATNLLRTKDFLSKQTKFLALVYFGEIIRPFMRGDNAVAESYNQCLSSISNPNTNGSCD